MQSLLTEVLNLFDHAFQSTMQKHYGHTAGNAMKTIWKDYVKQVEAGMDKIRDNILEWWPTALTDVEDLQLKQMPLKVTMLLQHSKIMWGELGFPAEEIPLVSPAALQSTLEFWIQHEQGVKLVCFQLIVPLPF